MNKMIKMLVCLSFVVCSANAQVGKTVSNLKLVDVKDTPKSIPFLGEKVFVAFYVDPDAQDASEPLTNAIAAKKFPSEKFGAIGIVNCKDTWIPNSLILSKCRQKQERFPRSVIMLDKKHLLASAWNLEKSNNAAIMVLVGKDSKIKLTVTAKSEEEGKALITSVIKAIEEELKK